MKNKIKPLFIVIILISVSLFVKVMYIGGEPPTEQSNNVEKFLLSGVQLSPTPDPILEENAKIELELIAVREENKKFIDLVSRDRERKPKVILDYNKLSAPKYIVELTERMCTKHGFDSIREIYTIMAYESKFEPSCHATVGEDSRGLLQVNVGHPAHAKRNPNKNKLFDPAYNLDYQLDELSNYYILGKKKGLVGPDLACFISKYGQRPKWSKYIETTIRQYDKEYLNAVVKG